MISPALLLSLMLSTSDYCAGWEAGWKQGWCYEQLHCAAPVPPACPIPVAGKNTTVHGYNDGFFRAREKAAKLRGPYGVKRP